MNTNQLVIFSPAIILQYIILQGISKLDLV